MFLWMCFADTNEENSIRQDSSHHSTESNTSCCLYCGKFFKSVNIHISKAHPKEHRDKLVRQLPPIILTDSLHNQEINNNNTNDNNSRGIENTRDQNFYSSELKRWLSVFSTNMGSDEFEEQFNSFSTFLTKSIDYLPGPKHPARKYYEARKSGKEISIGRNYKHSSNPTRSSKKIRQKRRERYLFEKTQYDFYNQRKKAVRAVLHGNKSICPIDSQILFQKFNDHFKEANNCIRTEYGPNVNETNSDMINETYNAKISIDEVLKAMAAIKIDTAPGPDRILMRALKNTTVAAILSLVYTRISETGFVPSSLKLARTILIYKDGDVNDPNNYRPISICSVLRRVLERILDSRLRRYVTFNPNQRGFSATPGAHTNVALLDGILKKAKSKRNSVTIVFLDVSKAFDNMGHNHISNTIRNHSLPTHLQNLILNLQCGNTTYIETQGKRTSSIKLNRGVMQGAPLSPALYNIATDFILDDLAQETVAKTYGYELVEGMKKITVLGFADDLVIVGKNVEAATALTNMAIERFHEIGLSLNTKKSVCISLDHNNLICKPIYVNPYQEIRSLTKNEKIRYLGVDFSDKIIIDEGKLGNDLKNHLEILAGSPLLKSEQKFAVINQFILPTLVYTFQNTPVLSISKTFLTKLDKLIKSTVKEILQLPADTPDAMLYSSKKVKGLGVYKTQWEAILQQFNACNILKKSENPYINQIRNLEAEKKLCITALGLDNSEILVKKPSSDIRGKLRSQAYNDWCQLRLHGKGVILYDQYPQANSWVTSRLGLTSAEWRDAIKLQGNLAPVRALHGRSQDNTRCRHCNEPETLPHVLGFCHYGELLRNNRHHLIRSTIAAALTKTGKLRFLASLLMEIPEEWILKLLTVKMKMATFKIQQSNLRHLWNNGKM